MAVAESGGRELGRGTGRTKKGAEQEAALAALAAEEERIWPMHLKSISMKGFKSFPHRTKLDFSPGVGVVVGPNGSGKSNITDAVLWALGEQSPLAVRGQSMKDVIFAGGHGVKGSSAAEVEVVIDNGDGGLENTDFSEISILRRLGRDGEGEYRLNGARCRLADVVEVLSDTGLGKEMHSVVSQGRVEAIVLSKPRDRRMLIEEAAGLGKHRKRRRRAQLKLERTEENLSRALDVEREARSRLRPLKRQAEAAQLHERLQRQSDEARYELSRDQVREVRALLATAEAEAVAAKQVRSQADAAAGRGRQAARGRRGGADRALAGARRAPGPPVRRALGARPDRHADGARPRPGHGRPRGRRAAPVAAARCWRPSWPRPTRPAPVPPPGWPSWRRSWPRWRARARSAWRPSWPSWTPSASGRRPPARSSSRPPQGHRQALEQAEAAAEQVRGERREAEKAAEAARSRAAQAGAELAAVNQFLRAAGSAGHEAPPLSDSLDVEPGYETALAAALGPRLQAGVVDDLPRGAEALDAAGDEGGMVIVNATRGQSPRVAPPCDGARLLLDHVSPSGAGAAVAERLLAGVWVVDSLADVPDDFPGSAVTTDGRVWRPSLGELRQAPAGGAERVLEQRNRRSQLVTVSEEAVRAESEARAAVEAVDARVAEADTAREQADRALRDANREAQSAAEAARHAGWLMERRREAPDEGPDAVRRAELSAEVRAERRVAEGAVREHEERVARVDRLKARIERDGQVAAAAERAARALDQARDAVAGSMRALEAEQAEGADAGERTAAQLRECAGEEAQLQTRLREAGERVTTAEVAAQRARDGAADVERTLTEVAGRLGLEAEPAEEALEPEKRVDLEGRIERLARRREQLGPVNPLAAREYEEAVQHVEELEVQRKDLEGALGELTGLIRDTDRRIRESFEETFEAAAKNFEEVVGHLFPGGSGKLRLVQPRPDARGRCWAATRGGARRRGRC